MLLSLFSSLGSSSAEGTSASLSLPLIETFGELETEESFLEALTNSGGTPGSKKSEKKEKKCEYTQQRNKRGKVAKTEKAFPYVI